MIARSPNPSGTAASAKTGVWLLCPKARPPQCITPLPPAAWAELSDTVSRPLSIPGPAHFPPLGWHTGKEIRVNDPQPLFLVRGLNRLAGTRIRTIPFATSVPTQMLDGYELRMPRLLADDAPEEEAKLVLVRGGIEQVLYTWPQGRRDDAHCELEWAGDLDGDGKPDLYMTLSEHYHVWEHTLFLSSAARARQLVERVAVFTVPSC